MSMPLNDNKTKDWASVHERGLGRTWALGAITQALGANSSALKANPWRWWQSPGI